MSIKSISNYNFSTNNISFSKRKDNNIPLGDTNSKEHKRPAVPAGKLVPAMIALAGVTTLSSCSEDLKYNDMKSLEDNCFVSFDNNKKNLSKIEEKLFVIDENTDSVFKETSEYKYSHIKIKSKDHSRVFGEIHRKIDGMKIEFVNVYDENDELTSSTLKDLKTKDTYYITYNKGFLEKVTDKEGKELPGSKYGKYIILMMLGFTLYGAGKMISNSVAPKMTNKDVPFVEPPKNDD